MLKTWYTWRISTSHKNTDIHIYTYNISSWEKILREHWVLCFFHWWNKDMDLNVSPDTMGPLKKITQSQTKLLENKNMFKLNFLINSRKWKQGITDFRLYKNLTYLNSKYGMDLFNSGVW